MPTSFENLQSEIALKNIQKHSFNLSHVKNRKNYQQNLILSFIRN